MSEPAAVAAPPVSELGIRRRMARLTTADGFFAVAALDHPENYLALFDPDISRVSYDTVVSSKLELAAHLAPHASALLLDPVWSLGQAIGTAAVPGSIGLMSSIELLSYTPEGFGLETHLRPEWTPEKIASIGGDGVKLYLSYRAEQTAVATEQRRLVADLAARCHAVQLPLVVEPIWYPMAGEDLADERIQARRAAGIVASAAEFAALGADILKVQFPGSVRTEAARRAAEAAARELDEGLEVPWVLLSEGVGFEEFAEQLTVVAQAGASGYIAGRAIWGDAVGALPDGEREAGLRRAAERLDALTAITRAHGRPYRPYVPVDEAASAVPVDWHVAYGR